MKDRRTVVLMAVLLALLGVFVFNTTRAPLDLAAQNANPAGESLLPGENEIRSVDIAREDNGSLYATVHYYYRGGLRAPKIRVLALSPDPDSAKYWQPEQLAPMEKGEHSVKIEIVRPYQPDEEFASSKVMVSIHDGYIIKSPGAQKEIDYKIAWTTRLKYDNDRVLAKKTNDELYKDAVELVDRAESYDSLDNAKLYLERLLLKDPSFVPAYSELARIAMKSNWNAEGLKQAESYLKLGLSHQPEHANSHVLLGYVYTHQNKYEEALREFEQVAKLGTDNLWLWSNWGELHKLQGESDKAVAMYLKAVDGPRPFNTNDRARLDAYRNLFALLDNQQGLAQAEALYVKRADEFADQPCLRSDYAAFRVYGYQDYDGALTQTRKAIANGCNNTYARQIMGIANYVAWLNGKPEQRAAYLNEAQMLYPASPQLIYQLAADDHTADVLNELAKLSISIEIKDKNKLNALSYALAQNDIDAARRLIAHGAKLNETVGEQDYPVAMTPIFYQHVEGVQLLIDQGVNWSTIKFRGETAVDYAEKTQNNDIIRLVKKIKT